MCVPVCEWQIRIELRKMRNMYKLPNFLFGTHEEVEGKTKEFLASEKKLGWAAATQQLVFREFQNEPILYLDDLFQFSQERKIWRLYPFWMILVERGAGLHSLDLHLMASEFWVNLCGINTSCFYDMHFDYFTIYNVFLPRSIEILPDLLQLDPFLFSSGVLENSIKWFALHQICQFVCTFNLDNSFSVVEMAKHGDAIQFGVDRGVWKLVLGKPILTESFKKLAENEIQLREQTTQKLVDLGYVGYGQYWHKPTN